MSWTRPALEARVAKLAEEHEGEELVEAVQEFGEQLDEDERELLGRILLERAPRVALGDYPRWQMIFPRRRRRK
jgi:hypothetical protein